MFPGCTIWRERERECEKEREEKIEQKAGGDQSILNTLTLKQKDI